MKTRMVTVVGILTALSSLPGFAHAAEVSGTNSVDCVDLNRIDHTRVVDDRNILFYMRGGDVYLNQLTHAAPGLGRNQPFMYRTSISRLCSGETITVLEDWGFGFMQGASTGLGKFQPIDEARADALGDGVRTSDGVEPLELQ